jgi:Domain of unknown function (DUF397)
MSRYESMSAERSALATAGTPAEGSFKPSPIAWRKPAFCQSGECIEVAASGDAILIRDSKDPGPVQVYSAAEFRAFAMGIRAGDYDDLIGAAGS